MNLPKHIEEKFDKKFKCIQGDCDGHGYIPRQVDEGEWEADQCQFHAEYLFPLKSFIAQILEEEKERLVGEIVKNYEQQLLTYKPHLRKEIDDYHLAKNQTDAINLIKK